MNEEIKKYTEMFHNTYEMLAPKYGYETRGDTKQLDFDSPNGKLMYSTIEKIVCPILEENKQLKGSLQTYEILLKANVEENQKLKEQQKEFMEWLEKYILERDEIRNLHKMYTLSEERLSSQYFVLQGVLSKYKEIIGDYNNE